MSRFIRGHVIELMPNNKQAISLKRVVLLVYRIIGR